jgi:hypothetical protein
MKKLVLLTAMAFAAIVSNAQTATTPVVDINKVLEFKNADYNAGQTLFGKPVEFTVEIKNISKDTVTLITAKAGCGCTTPNFTPNQKFGPGQVAKVNITFNGGQNGQYTKLTDIIFDNGLTKQVKLTGVGVTSLAPPAVDASAAMPVKAKSDKN